MDRREAERGRALVAAALAAQERHFSASAAEGVARMAAEKARDELVAWVEANGKGKSLVYDGQSVCLEKFITLVPLASLDPPAPTPAPPPPQPAPTKGGKK